MGVIYRNEFTSLEGIQWKIDILDDDYSSSVGTFKTLDEGFTLSYSAGSNRFDPIIGSKVKILAAVEDSTFEDMIDDMAENLEDRFWVKIYKDGTFWWGGMLLPDLARMADAAYPYDFEMVFTDGLGRLKDVKYDKDGVLYDDRDNLIDIICICLDLAGIAALWGVDDTFLHTCVHWYDDHHDFYVDSDPLKYTDVDQRVFTKIVDKTPTAISAKEVLEDILLTFGARIYQSAGAFRVIQVNELRNTTLITRWYKKAGTFIDAAYDSDYTEPAVNYTRMQGGFYDFFPPLNQVEREYKYSQSYEDGNLLPDQTQYETAVDFLTGISGGDGETLQFSGTVWETFTLSAEGEPFLVKYRINMIITKADLTKRYLTNGPNGEDPFSWSASSADYVTIWSHVNLHPQTTYHNFFTINFITPEIPWAAAGTFEMDFVGYFTEEGGSYSPPGISFSYLCQDFTLLLWLELMLPAEGIRYFTSTNDNGELSAVLKLKQSRIGDGPNPISLGRLMASDGSTWWLSTEWSIKNGSQEELIQQLLVDEVLLGQQTPCKRYHGSIHSDTYEMHKVLVFSDSSHKIPLAMQLKAFSDIWQGDWFDANLQTTGLQTGIDIDSETYNAGAEWYLQGWSLSAITQDDGTRYERRIPYTTRRQSRLIEGKQLIFLSMMASAVLDEDIAVGAIRTTITVEAIVDAVLLDADELYLVNRYNFSYDPITMDANQAAEATTLTIASHTFSRGMPEGSFIVFNLYEVLKNR